MSAYLTIPPWILVRCERIVAASADPICAAYFRGAGALGWA